MKFLKILGWLLIWLLNIPLCFWLIATSTLLLNRIFNGTIASAQHPSTSTILLGVIIPFVLFLTINIPVFIKLSEWLNRKFKQ